MHSPRPRGHPVQPEEGPTCRVSVRSRWSASLYANRTSYGGDDQTPDRSGQLVTAWASSRVGSAMHVQYPQQPSKGSGHTRGETCASSIATGKRQLSGLLRVPTEICLEGYRPPRVPLLGGVANVIEVQEGRARLLSPASVRRSSSNRVLDQGGACTVSWLRANVSVT
eukprot:scaffold1058_cov362-Prasinococcus_capsulatus_cf.AAC.15